MTTNATARVQKHAREGCLLRESFFAANEELIVSSGRALAVALAGGKKILLCGNGGSAADAQHLAAEFVNRYIFDRPPLAAVALSTDSSILTAVGNDFSFDQVFSKQVQALGNQGDVLIGISTSGNSANVILALEAARKNGMVTMGLTGRDGGHMGPLCDILINVPSAATPLVQEVHIAIGHLLCELTDYFLFENTTALAPFLEAIS